MVDPSTPRSVHSMCVPGAPHTACAQKSHCLDDVFRLLGLGGSLHASVCADTDTAFRCQKVRAGHALYRMGQDFESIYVVRLGQLKTVLHDINGDEHILSFPMKGDFLGFDGIYLARYASDAVALTDSEVLVLPYRQILALGHRSLEFERVVYAAASREMNRERTLESLQHCLKAEARVAWFLEMQAERYAALGYSSKNFVLPMTRRDIGNYLRVSLETVSRSLSALAQAAIIQVQRREIRILQPELLHQFRPVRGQGNTLGLAFGTDERKATANERTAVMSA